MLLSNMWLYTIIVAACVISSINHSNADIATEKNENQPAPLNTVDEDFYIPALDWSDEFDWKLFKAISTDYQKNVLISPLSIKLALLMLYEGSSGSTEKQFQSVLQFPTQKAEIREKYKQLLYALQDKRTDFILNIGTRLFLDNSIQPHQQYAAIIKSAYDTDIQPTNFSNPIEANDIINSWVDILTNGRIKEITGPDDLQNDVLLLLANAVYFKGRWLRKFPKNNTHEGGFYISPTEIVTVSYMSNTDKYYYIESKELDAKILRLPYKGNHFSFFIILPNSKGGLSDLIKNIDLARIKRQLYIMDKRTVDVVIPKFRFDFGCVYSKILQDFGLTTMFSNTASFPAIARGVGYGTKWLFVNEIKQKSGIEINEEGSTVYAATEIELGNKFGEANVTFNATHPFLVFLEDQTTGTILFAGKIVNPLQADYVETPSRQSDSGLINLNSVSSQSNADNSNFPSLNPVLPPQHNTISPRFNYFDLELLESFDDKKNYFISPASIKATLGMILEGARGRCAEEIGRALRVPIDQSSTRDKLRSLLYDFNARSGTTVIESANAAFISDVYQFVPEYQKNLQEYYKALVTSVNFSNIETATYLINTWVQNVTRGLITDILSPGNFNSDATLVIINALYFNGRWKNEFEEKSTSIKCFYNTRENCINAKMMQTVDNFNYKFIDSLDAQAIELPYGDGEYSMLVLLPSREHSVDGLIRDFKFVTFSSIVDKLEPSEVLVTLPKFEIEYTADIVSDLQRLGIEEIFGPNANLSGIVPRGQIKVNNIVHKAKIRVDEKGTVAAAATGVIVIPLMGSSSPRFVADRPFLFFIYHVQSKNILFAGRLNKPLEAYDEIFAKPDKFPITDQKQQIPLDTQSYKKQEAVALSLENSQKGKQMHPVYFPADTVSRGNNYQFQQSNQNNANQQRIAEERQMYNK